MANLRLSALAKQFEDKTPTNVNELSNLNTTFKTLYADVKFDLNELPENSDNKFGIIVNNPINSKISKKDIEKLVNEDAIINSVKNWFRTDTYMHLLNPNISFGINKYIFEQLNEYTAYFLALDIISFLPIYEPRIDINKCDIKLDYNNSAYIIELQIIIPSLNNKIINFKDILTESGFSTL